MFSKNNLLNKKLNINGKLVKETSLPFKINQALLLENQAMFNPLKFIKHICKDLRIYENTKAIKINKNMIECENEDGVKCELQSLKEDGQDMEYVTVFPPKTGFIATNFITE